MIIINPGTEPRGNTNEANARVVADHIIKAFRKQLPQLRYERVEEHDADGWYCYEFCDGGRTVLVDIPGDKPKEVMQGEPWASRRLYVDGSSWLYQYALDIIGNRFGLEEE